MADLDTELREGGGVSKRQVWAMCKGVKWGNGTSRDMERGGERE